MLPFLRRARVLSLVALFVIGGTVPTSMSALLHDDGDDVLCQPSVVFHDEAAHRVGAVHVAAPQPQHCAVCHWMQSIQLLVGVAMAAGPASEFQQLIASALPPALQQTPDRLPARAPPQL